MYEIKAALEVIDDTYIAEDPQSFPSRGDMIGRLLDGYDYVLNNPPGFAISVALEAARGPRSKSGL